MGWSRVEFLETGDEYFKSLLTEFGSARRSVLLEFYIFRMDRLGREVLGALSNCRQRGVEVFLRVDGIGSSPDLQEISEFCEKERIELEVFHPLPFERARQYFAVGFAKADSFLTRWRLINRRTHRKLVIVDEKVAFAGGMNVDEVQVEKFGGSPAWHDLSLRLEGRGVRELLDAFWFRPFHHFTFYNCLLNYSWRLRQARNRWISRAISRAQRKVWVISPYFAPTPAMLYQLKSAARRGVDIRIILTKKSDVLISRLAALGLYRKLVNWGIRIYEFEPSLLHRKLTVIDRLAMVGSGNLNHRSFIHDLELDIILRKEEEVEKASELFLADQRQSRIIEEDYLEKLGLGKRILSWLAGWLSYWL
jgi:cardiolipin synthase A/B